MTSLRTTSVAAACSGRRSHGVAGNGGAREPLKRTGTTLARNEVAAAQSARRRWEEPAESAGVVALSSAGRDVR